MTNRPTLSYTIWFTQRCGSSWLCQALASTKLAGNPGELLSAAEPERLVQHYQARSVSDLVSILYRHGSSPNGVFGLKQGFCEPRFSQLMVLFQDAITGKPPTRLEIWESVFPKHKHIFLTRRNKVRLAVSWWRAIQSGEWHRRHGTPRSAVDLSDGYNFDAINHLFNESVLREAGIQDLFDEAGTAPLMVAYEDLRSDFDGTVRGILNFLDVDAEASAPFDTNLAPTADKLSEEWVRRFRREKQAGWRNIGW
ncbi:MAG: Stf0 family sulfotransferase [Pseudomonadota bacterium]